MAHDREFLLLLLETILIEIQSLEPHELPIGPKLAYLVHTVPGVLNSDASAEAAEHAYDVIKGRAEALRLGQWLAACEQGIAARIEHRHQVPGDKRGR